MKTARQTAGTKLEPGTSVEVLNGLATGWAHGFEVAAAVEHGYRLRRISDGSVLPQVFQSDSIRPHSPA